MRIIHLISAKSWGGGERYAFDLSEASSDDGCEVEVFCRKSPAVESRFDKASIVCRRLPLGGALDVISPVILARYLRGDDAILIHVHNFKTATVAARARTLAGNKRVKIVLTRHLVKPGKNTASYRWLYREIDAIVFVSELAREGFLSGKPDIDASRLRVIHNGVQQPFSFTVPKFRQEGQLRIMYHGRLAEEKGIDPLVRSMALLKNEDVKLIVAGEGQGRYVMPLLRRSKADGTEEMIEWKGFVEKIDPLIDSCDVGIVPSIARESFCLSLVEYMAQGKPVITTAVGAQREIMTDGKEGIFIDENSPEAIAGAIRRLAHDPDLRRRMGTDALATFEARFDFPIFYKKMKSLYLELLSH